MLAHTLPWIEVWIFAFGATIGSFLNVVIGRVPGALLALEPGENEDASPEVPRGLGRRIFWGLAYVAEDIAWSVMYLWQVFPRELRTALGSLSQPRFSHCQGCQQPIRFYDNIPILSWFILRGRCRQCRAPFSFRYPLNELVTAGLFFYAYHIYGLSVSLPFILCFLALLQVIFWIDFDHQFIFNVITYPGILLGLFYNLSRGTLAEGLLGAGLGFVLLESVALLSIWLLKKEGMGGGDVKLAILLGMWLGAPDLLVALVLAFMLGAVIGSLLLMMRRTSQPFPFGPALAVGGFGALTGGEFLRAWYQAWYINAVMF